MTEGPWLNETEQRAWRAYLAMSKRLATHLSRDLQREFDLSPQDYEILVCLSEAPGRRMRAVELGRATEWEKSRLSHQLSRMERRGMVSREPVPGVRYPEVVLTDRGLAAITEAAPRHAAAVRAAFLDALGPERLDRFAEACSAIARRVGAVEAERGDGPC
ncbi:MarR family winged helix-turn-helix transcriptional regulator [Streptomyces sp. B1866]|uniref:MarR family winged helix-turn-helix transcriptional regulator n=1 Tax=Streptomyces sp. B1866 TaxID=3075431 RepID=UPI00288D824D|nr:MarR family winged helix-turn-helix transcriptional regulator [Streptomyces sp. B1866]MDT3396407.1 MarR family winged helix-turn-helix transcriptional regulator [Streptomyces sp. B1866]